MLYSLLADKRNQEADNYNNSKEELIAIEAEIQKWEALREQIADANIAEAATNPVVTEVSAVSELPQVSDSPLVDKFISDVKSGNIDSPTVIEAAEHLSGVYAEIVRDKKRTKEQQKKAEEIINLLQALKTQTLKESSEQTTSLNSRNAGGSAILKALNLLTSRLPQTPVNIDLQNVVSLRQNQVREVTSVAQNNMLQQQLSQLNTITNQLATNLKAADMFLRQVLQNAVVSEVVNLNQAIKQNVANATALNASRAEINNIVASQQQVNVQQLKQIQEKVAVQVQQIAQNSNKVLEQIRVSNPQIQSNIQEIARQTVQIAERAKQLEVVQKISEVIQPVKGGYSEIKQNPTIDKNIIAIKSPVVEKIVELAKQPVIMQPEVKVIGGGVKLEPKSEPIKIEPKQEPKSEPREIKQEKIEVKSHKAEPIAEEKPTGKVGACGGCTGSACGTCFVTQWRAGVASGQFKPPAEVVATQATVISQREAVAR